MAEELDLHLLDLPAAEGVIARVDLVAEGLASLSNSKRQFKPRAIEDVVEVDEDALSGFGAQVSNGRSVFQGSNVGLEHEIKLTRICERTGLFALGAGQLFSPVYGEFNATFKLQWRRRSLLTKNNDLPIGACHHFNLLLPSSLLPRF